MRGFRTTLAVLGVVCAIAIPLALAARSPLLAWREPIYIVAGFAGIVALALLLTQPLLAAGHFPGLRLFTGRRVHRVTGVVLVLAVLIHVIGLWITSPPDVIDVLLFRSPTPFSVWGVIAMWALFGAAGLALVRRRLRLRVWRLGHTVLVVVVVIGSVVHAMLIEGTMETISKAALCLLALAGTAKAVADLRVWAGRGRVNR
ncbi:ferric reductase-like transmembrane domain-containing protein [Aliiroseovarius sp. Z3]|uniref:ferric reductase-like transmembrane domain-containing protein n=1 Tax=Aliiroseovarius sp. Z3 TaxID=2811402 RepID=UPI0023B2278F|nr:ferric reductase-like transmembrane domain-containing protein [Aliiroseovarius sp. Z3]MDE9452034.1 ferric reductase-like transmembrane domain-containing protein [Aliiroseovarius sp. Z3]